MTARPRNAASDLGVWLIAAAICLGPVFPAAARQALETTEPAPQRQALRDDLIGLRIGTAAVTARTFLEANGFTMRTFETGLSWYGRVGELTGYIVERRFRRSITSAQFGGPAGEQLELFFTQTPGGAALARAELILPGTVTPAVFQTSLAARFGAPNCGQHWCPTPRPTRRRQAMTLSPRFIADPEKRSIVLDAGQDLQALEDRSVAQAAKDCRLTRLGVDLAPGYFMFAC